MNFSKIQHPIGLRGFRLLDGMQFECIVIAVDPLFCVQSVDYGAIVEDIDINEFNCRQVSSIRGVLLLSVFSTFLESTRATSIVYNCV